jgi:hypothetical protein
VSADLSVSGSGGNERAADPRAADVAEAGQLLDGAEVRGAAPLPALTAAELWVLCGVDQVLATEPEARWWASLTRPDREELTGAVLESLAARGLLRLAGEAQPPAQGQPGRLLVTAPLGMIVAARQYPAMVVVAAESDGPAASAPRMYGVGSAGRLPQAIVGEYVSDTVIRPFGPVHYFSLLSPARAGHVLARWATRPRVGDGPGQHAAGRQPRIVDVYGYREGTLAGRDRMTVSGTDDGHLAMRQRPGACRDPALPVACDLAGLADLLTGMLALDQP